MTFIEVLGISVYMGDVHGSDGVLVYLGDFYGSDLFFPGVYGSECILRSQN